VRRARLWFQKYSNNSVFDNELWGANFGVLR
jgi:hypothetical protein